MSHVSEATTDAPTDLPAEAEAFAAAWTEFFAAVRTARGRVAAQPGGEITLSQHQVLLALGENESMRPGELAVAAGIAAPTVTRMLAGLEDEGIVERRHSESDRRAVSVSLTANGRDLLDEKRALVNSKIRSVFDSLPAAKRDDAVDILTRLAAAIRDIEVK